MIQVKLTEVMYSPFCEFLEADFEPSVVISVLFWWDIKEALCDVEGSLVDRRCNASLQLHLKQLGVWRMLTQRMLKALNLILHPENGHLQRWKVNLRTQIAIIIIGWGFDG